MSHVWLRLLAAALFLCLGTAGAVAETLRVAYEDRELPPYYLGNGAEVDAQRPGLSVELVRMAATDLGLDLRITRMPWLRCLAALERGEIDAIFNASFKEDRMANGVYPMLRGHPDPSRRIAAVTYVLYRKAGGAVAWDGRSLAHLSTLGGPIGTPAGYSIADDLEKAGVPVQEAPDTTANFRKLDAGRITAVATLDVIGDALLPSFPGLEKVEPPLVTKDYFVMLSHQFVTAHPVMADRLWQRIATLRDAKGPELVRKYGN